MTEPTILVHGGAWDIPERWREDTVVGCRRAADAGFDVLRAGGTALDAVVAAIRELEDHPSLGAGRGAAMDQNGDFHLDAALMRGHDLAAAAAALIPPTRHPIDLARAILEHSPHVLLVGEDALAWGEQYGVKPCDPDELRTPKNMERIVWGDDAALQHASGCEAERAGQRDPLLQPKDEATHRIHSLFRLQEHGHDTVGAIALDAHGHIVAGLSTGGTPGRHPARVGDVPVIGAGLYAEDGLGGAAATGSGEGIIRVTLARMCLEDIRHGAHPQEVAEARLRHMTERTGLKGGLILLDAQGRVGLWHNTEAMCFAKRGGEAFEGWRVG